jgi:predicted nucleic acid-binding Zn ribbon protein
MPIYDYEHVDAPGPGCEACFEHVHGMNERLEQCPRCGGAVRKVVSRFAKGRDVLGSANIREKGFRRFRRKEKGVYEED